MVHSSTKRILLSEALRSIFPDFCEVGKIDDDPFGGWHSSLRKAVSLAELFSLANNMVYGGNFSYFVFG